MVGSENHCCYKLFSVGREVPFLATVSNSFRSNNSHAHNCMKYMTWCGYIVLFGSQQLRDKEARPGLAIVETS